MAIFRDTHTIYRAKIQSSTLYMVCDYPKMLTNEIIQTGEMNKAVESEQNQGKLELIAFKSFSNHDELVYIIDFLNKSLKDKNIMFGLTKNKEDQAMTINIYEF